MQTISYKRGLLHVDSNAISALIVAKNEQGESKQFNTVRAAKEWLNRYNGHKNWNYWNVSLWINNDENLYHLAKACLKGYNGIKQQCARGMLLELRDRGVTHTPDGALYSISSIKAAMRDL